MYNFEYIFIFKCFYLNNLFFVEIMNLQNFKKLKIYKIMKGKFFMKFNKTLKKI